MSKIKVLIADDNQDSLEIIAYYVEQFSSDFEIVGLCDDGIQLVEQVMIKKPDLVLMDIQMPMKNGIDVAKECLALNPKLKFIFITGYDEFAVQAFAISAVDYIVKPIEKTRLYLALEKAKNSLVVSNSYHPTNSWKKRLSIRYNGSFYFIPFDEIIFIEKVGKKCVIHTQSNTYETNEIISELLKNLDDTFFQTHRSYLVNLKMISHITPMHETYFVYFLNFEKHAHASKLKIIELQEKLSVLMKRL